MGVTPVTINFIFYDHEDLKEVLKDLGISPYQVRPYRYPCDIEPYRYPCDIEPYRYPCDTEPYCNTI